MPTETGRVHPWNAYVDPHWLTLPVTRLLVKNLDTGLSGVNQWLQGDLLLRFDKRILAIDGKVADPGAV